MASDGPLDREPSLSVRVARLRLSLFRVSRDQPRLVALLVTLVLVCGVLALQVRSCPPAAHCPKCATAGSSVAAAATASIGPSDPRAVLPRPTTAGAERNMPLSMAQVVVGVMTARRFHSTRCRMQRETWLRRARRVIFFSDGPDARAELEAPLVAHEFEPSATERIFAGGNWRAVPILRAMAHAFFSTESQKLMGERGEPLPLWAFMCGGARRPAGSFQWPFCTPSATCADCGSARALLR